MLFAVLAVVGVLYLAGVGLLVSALVLKRGWTEDEDGQLHYSTESR